MKDITLRAQRTYQYAPSVPEFADNQLTLEMSCPDPYEYTTELFIRVFSEDYCFMGSDTRTLTGKIPRKTHFHIDSSLEWKAGKYQVYIYRNCIPLWFTTIELPYEKNKWAKAKFESIENYPDEEFFAQQLNFTSWWPRLHDNHFKNSLIRELISKCRILDSQEAPIMNLLAIGGKSEYLATYILGSHFANYQNPEELYKISLEELVYGPVCWEQLVQEIKQKKLVVVKITQMIYDYQTINTINMFADLLGQDNREGAVVIFHGSENHVLNLCIKCDTFSRLFAEKNIFYTKENEDNPDETDQSTEISQKTVATVSTTLSAEQALQELVGLERLKQDMQEARLMALFTRKRQELHLDSNEENRHHMLFFGNPGTGKTTVAKLVGEMYHQMGLLSVGHTIETNRSKLIGEFIGQTEKRMNEVIAEARGGVLFIDEAYALVEKGEDSKDYGKEVINALLPVLSEPNPDLIVILAGYEDKMKHMIQTNPGLHDRFPLHFHFDDYSPAELEEMAHRLLRKRNFKLTAEAGMKLKELIEKTVRNHDEHFGNGRWLHNLIDQGILKSMAYRVMTLPKTEQNIQLFSTIEASDIQAAGQRMTQNQLFKQVQPTRIGFHQN